jgi:hypothetical protein
LRGWIDVGYCCGLTVAERDRIAEFKKVVERMPVIRSSGSV